MTSTRTMSVFDSTPRKDGYQQVIVWISIVALLIAAWTVGQLQNVCLAVIAILTIRCVVVDYFARFATPLDLDKRRSAEELVELKSIPADRAKEVAGFDPDGTGTLFQIVSAIARYGDRTPKEQIIERHLMVVRERLETALQPVLDAVQKCPMLGLGGSLLGMLAALKEFSLGGDASAVGAGMSTMVSTTLAGCAASLLLVGLASRGQRLINQYLAELEKVSSMVITENPKSDTTNINTMFLRKPRRPENNHV